VLGVERGGVEKNSHAPKERKKERRKKRIVRKGGGDKESNLASFFHLLTMHPMEWGDLRLSPCH
jgi:hypothetical protein